MKPYQELPEVQLYPIVVQMQMLADIKEELMKEYIHLNDTDTGMLKIEQITKVLLGIKVTEEEARIYQHKDNKKERLTTPLQDLINQVHMIQGTDQNKEIFRIVLALMLNGRQIEIEQAIKREFPEYFRFKH